MNLRNNILLLLGVILLATVLIVIVFVIINACIKKRAAKYKAKSQGSSTSHEMGRRFSNLCDQEGKPPQLPSRQQFETDSCHDYEDAISLPDIPKEPVKPSLLQPQTTVNHLYNHKAFQDNESISESYDDVNAIEQNGHMCVDVNFPPINLKEPAESLLLQPRTINYDHNTHTDFQDNKSISENYDDVDEIEQNVVDSFNDDLTPPDYLDLDQSRNSLDSYYDIGELDAESEDYDDLG